MIRRHLKEYTDSELLDLVQVINKEQQSRFAAKALRDRGLEFILQRKHNYETAVMAEERYCGKPKKALIVFSDTHQDISLFDGKAMSTQYIYDWCSDTGVSPSEIKYVLYDGILFGFTLDKVLADVMTGIEI